MPELPEVEFCARKLRQWIGGRRVLGADALPGKPLRDLEPAQLTAGLRGRRVEAINRRGKQLFWSLDDGHVLLVHLGMTGKFVRTEPGEAWRPGERVRFTLDETAAPRALAFVDPRRFGRVRLLPRDAAQAHPEIAKLGPDALQLCEVPGGLRRVLRGRRPIKVALMDQSVLAGVGNIYASEALFGARVHPFTPAEDLKHRQVDALQKHLLGSMLASLEREQAEEIEYLHEADSSNPFIVYDREGEPCPRCSTALRRETQAGRSTYFCPRCQRAVEG